MADHCHNTPSMPEQSRPAFPLEEIIKTDDPERWCNNLAYMVESMILTARCALENDGTATASDEARCHAAANTLEVAQALLAIVNEGSEHLQRKARVGLFEGRTAA